MEDKNSYFMSVVKDAVLSLKEGKEAYCFFQEQVDCILEQSCMKKNYRINVKEKDGIFYLTRTNKA